MILAIDQGTTGTIALVFDAAGRPVGRGYAEITQHFPRPGWVEHDAAEIWEVTRRVGHAALADAGLTGADLAAIGLTNQRETAVAWDRATGEPLHRAIVWQDRRTAARCDALRAAGREPVFRERTGLVLDPYFSGTKYEWLLREGGVGPRALLGTIDAWLVHKLCGRHVTDYSNAARTLLFDIRRLRWDEELCAELGVPPAMLPEPVPNTMVYGHTTEFGGRVPVCGMAGDQQAALYGQGGRAPGIGKNTYGTGNFLLQNAGAGSPLLERGLITTIAWGIGDRVEYALESSMFVTGAAVQWLRDGLGIIEQAADTEPLAASLDSNDGVYFVPALAGLGSPHWDPYARGTIVGLTGGSGRAQLARATLEAIAYQTADAVQAQDTALGVPLTELRADGGATVNAWLMQFQADVLGVPVVVPEVAQTTALGAAYLAGVSAGVWSEEETAAMWREGRRHEPRMGEDERAALLAGWRRAVERAKGWAVGGPSAALRGPGDPTRR
jgi:glycerol kinase